MQVSQLLFRYPGGKSKLAGQIVQRLKELSQGQSTEYREPFFGGGAVGLRMLGHYDRAWINDRDPGISCLWESVFTWPNLLKAKVLEFQPDVRAFEECKRFLLQNPERPVSDQDAIEYGFKKLVVHQLSFSGLGTRAGGPLGGKHQEGPCKVDGRWSAKRLCSRIDAIHQTCRGKQVRVTNGDFEPLITDTGHDATIYLDPPYLGKGNMLYQHGFTPMDHERLAELLRSTRHRWLLSYDDCDQIRDLYSWAEVREIPMTCTISHTRERKTELLITRKGGIEAVVAA